MPGTQIAGSQMRKPGSGFGAPVPPGARPTSGMPAPTPTAAPPLRAPGKGYMQNKPMRGKPSVANARPFGMVARTNPLDRGMDGVK